MTKELFKIKTKTESSIRHFISRGIRTKEKIKVHKLPNPHTHTNTHTHTHTHARAHTHAQTNKQNNRNTDRKEEMVHN